MSKEGFSSLFTRVSSRARMVSRPTSHITTPYQDECKKTISKVAMLHALNNVARKNAFHAYITKRREFMGNGYCVNLPSFVVRGIKLEWPDSDGMYMRLKCSQHQNEVSSLFRATNQRNKFVLYSVSARGDLTRSVHRQSVYRSSPQYMHVDTGKALSVVLTFTQIRWQKSSPNNSFAVKIYAKHLFPIPDR